MTVEFLALVASVSACEGEIDNNDFIGWVDAASGFVLMDDPDESLFEPQHLLNTARFPCAGCFRTLPSFEDHETVLRLASPAGRSLVIKWTTLDLNLDRGIFPLADIAPAERQGGNWLLPRAAPGRAAIYLGTEAFDEVGELEVVEALWPQYPGDRGEAWIEIRGASFEGVPVTATLVLDLAMRRAGDVPEEFGGRGEPCASASCAADLLCIAENTEMVCRQACARDVECPGEVCAVWPGVGGICRPARNDGERGAACLPDRLCLSGAACNIEESPPVCRQPCFGNGYDPLCGGSSVCANDLCFPAIEPGLANGSCRQGVCDLPNLVCIAEPAAEICRSTCTADESEDPCGPRFACLPRINASSVCQSANLEFEVCPCDDHLRCVIVEGDPAGGICRRPCTWQPDGTDDCPAGVGECLALQGSATEGVCVTP